ncbi:aldehyde dehydrogenase (NADP(+)) [Rhizobium sp. R693]|uniref:aldehyde dehydrogenase (NADP(+)) n=1 Tax=Rhizobium sp. R693 TaxID=1764276 RepID=UPI000B535F31|nr:aldehyde dehydrogenase (NADP(+)) [Rhizobium sp. R693]OWV98792.1 2,5-dioxovalerate dehydrogenase [Rhizobium sp. R693]
MLTGKHLIAGQWKDGEGSFRSSTITGDDRTYSSGSSALVAEAVVAAEAAFPVYSALPRGRRAAFLRAIAEEIDGIGAEITEVGSAETGLPEARLEGERARTTGQLRLFADHIEDGSFLDRRHDVALPDRMPLPRPDLRLIQRPIGPVAVFGASNFPLAFSTAGGDTAAALAAGCPVVVKGHSAHPGTGELVAQAIDKAIRRCDLPLGVFSLIQGGNRAVGNALVQHPLIKAVGFTGSLVGGRALFDLAMARPEPIPFFGELGSINPLFVLPEALRARAVEIGLGWAASLTLGVGQFCTNPGVAIAVAGADADRLVSVAASALAKVQAAPMLTGGMAQSYRDGTAALAGAQGVVTEVGQASPDRGAAPFLFRTTAKNWLSNPKLHSEVFGPSGVVVEAEGLDELLDVARSFEGQLTFTIQLDEEDAGLAGELLAIAERRAGRILCNGYPTGVEVCDSMVHGGPYPASTNFGATSVGTMSIRRFLRPVSYQNVPVSLLPQDLR